MPNYTLIKHVDEKNQFDNVKVTIEFDVVNLEDMLSAFTDFLRACGYVVNGDLEIRSDHEDCYRQE